MRIVTAVGKYEWLMFFHVTGAFLLLGGVVVAWVLGFAALRRHTPSEIALLFRLTGVAAASIGLGMLLTLGFGIWLVVDLDEFEITEGWILAALIMWVVAGALGGRGGRRDKETRLYAERLAAEGDAPSAELDARVRDPVALAFNVGSSVLAFAILVLMIWKPGA
jgi:uncharacterized membrane protein